MFFMNIRIYPKEVTQPCRQKLRDCRSQASLGYRVKPFLKKKETSCGQRKQQLKAGDFRSERLSLKPGRQAVALLVAHMVQTWSPALRKQTKEDLCESKPSLDLHNEVPGLQSETLTQKKINTNKQTETQKRL